MYTEKENEGIYMEKAVRAPDFSMKYEHFHIYCEIFYLKTGNCIYSVNNSIYHLSAGDLFIIAPGDSHSNQYEGLVPCERIISYCMLDAIPKTFWESHPDIRKKLSHSGKVVLNKKSQPQMESLLTRMLEENNLPDEYSCEFLTLQMMCALLLINRNGIFVYEQIKHEEGISTDIEDSLRYIAQNFVLPLTLEEVASYVNLSPSYFSRKFRRVTGVTFKEYVNYIRIRQASQMLLTTDESVTKIAVSCGFNSSNYFKDCFHRINGVSPRTFRQQAKSHSFDIEPQ